MLGIHIYITYIRIFYHNTLKCKNDYILLAKKKNKIASLDSSNDLHTLP